MIKSSHYKILLGTVVILAVFFVLYPFILSGFEMTSPDTPGLWCAAKTLITEKSFSDGQNNGPGVNACWEKNTYPTYQLFIAGAGWLFGTNNLGMVIILSSILGTILCILYTYLIVDKIWRDNMINLLVILFTSSSLSLGITNMLTPHNLWGFWGILLVTNELIKYFKNKKRLNLILAFLFFGATYFFHQLSFFVLLVSLFIFIWWSFRKWQYRVFGIFFALISVYILSIFYYHTYNIFNVLKWYGKKGETEIHYLFDHPLVLGPLLCLFGLVGLILFWRSKADKKIKILFSSLIIAPFIFTITPYFSLTVVPDRFLYFLWIPLVLLAPYGWFYFAKYLNHYIGKIFIYILLILILSLTSNFLVFEQSNFNKYSKPYLMSEEDKEAYLWMQENTSPEEEVLSVHYSYHHPSLLLSSFINNKISTYSPGLKYFTPYKAKLDYPDSEESALCKSIESGSFSNDYNFNWLIIWPDRIDGRLLGIFSKKGNLEFENDKIKIYSLNEK